jgi:hypothetical protein
VHALDRPLEEPVRIGGLLPAREVLRHVSRALLVHRRLL